MKVGGKKCGELRRKERKTKQEKWAGEGQRLTVGDLGMLILFVCLPAMIKLF